jgi:putative tricarboxylic transport membrane protein
MDFFSGMLLGFQVAFQPANLLVCFFGVLMGTLVGILPGLGSVATMSLLLPITFNMSPVSAIILLGGIYYGAAYGGSTTSILVNIPGETSSVMTCLDGYQMARQGRAGAALGISAFGSFIAGTLGIVGLMLVAPPLAEMALKFGPPEYFSLMILGMAILTFLSSGPMWKTLLTAAFGIFLGCIGLDTVSSTQRFTFGILQIADGISIVPIAMGLFGISEVMLNVEQGDEERTVFETKITNLLPTLQDWASSIWPIIRGTFMGFFLGTLPGGGAVISSFVSYAVEKRISKHPEKFGTGMIEGVAGPEAANNAGSEGAFIPLLALGIPCNAVMAVLLGALIVHGIQPGPLLIKNNPDIFWGILASMYLGNVMLLVLNLPLIGIWVQLLKVPYSILFPLILLFCVIGSYCGSNSTLDVILVAVFALIGYLFKKFKYELAPVILAFVLGPMMEESLRQSLLMAQGSPLIFLSRPISAVLMAIAVLILVFPFIPFFKTKRVSLVDSD